MGQCLSAPKDRAMRTRYLAESFFLDAGKKLLGAEFPDDPSDGDLVVDDVIVEMKQANNSHHFGIDIPQLQRLRKKDHSFQYCRHWYMLFNYHDKPNRSPLKKKRRSLVGKCRNLAQAQETLIRNTKNVFFIHPQMLWKLLSKNGATQSRHVRWGHPTLIIPRQNFLYRLRTDPAAVLREVGVSPRHWEVSTVQVELPFTIQKKDQELPLTLTVPVTEVHPSNAEPLSVYIPRSFLLPVTSALAA